VKTCILTTDTNLNHHTCVGHPERADRVTVVIDHLKKVKSKNLIWKKPEKFDLKYLTLAHDKNYLDNIKDSFPKQGLNFLDGDTIVSPGSKEATRDAVGSILTAIDGVMKKDFNNAFCAVRPPGHHAEKQKAMGFCVYNNIAVGAYYLLEKYKLKIVALLILMCTMVTEHRIFSMIMKKFSIFRHISIPTIQALGQQMKRVKKTTYSMYL